jgi:hypothetical protein
MNAVAAWAAGGASAVQAVWSPVDLGVYDRRGGLTGPELRALIELGPAHLRRSHARGARRRTPLWDSLGRLVGPLDEARAALHHAPDVRYRRAGAHAAGLVLGHCAELGQAYGGWTAEQWTQLCCASSKEFLDARTLPTETTVRPFLVALAYLLGGFTDLHRLGTFNRLHLAQLVFGAAVEEAMLHAAEILDQWGYRSLLSAKHRWRGVFSGNVNSIWPHRASLIWPHPGRDHWFRSSRWVTADGAGGFVSGPFSGTPGLVDAKVGCCG